MTTKAVDLLQRAFPSAMDFAALRDTARLPGYPGAYGCVMEQSIAGFAALALSALEQWRHVVVIAVDAIPWQVYARHRHRFDALCPVTSVVPSTSASAWTTILRGVLPHRHGVLGVVMYDEAHSATASLLSNSVFRLTGEIEQARLALPFLDGGLSLFARARAEFGADCHLLGLYALERHAVLAYSLAEGTRWRIEDDYNRLLMNPADMIRCYHRRIVDILERSGGGGNLIHTFFDFDTFLHETPYEDPRLDGFMEDLAAVADDLARRGACVLIVSDHGMVRQPLGLPPCSINDQEIWRHSYARPGGAGRILYFYPRPDAQDALVSRLQELVGETAWIMSRDAFLSTFIDPRGEGVNGAGRVGEIVAVARSASFPSVMRESINEHGALSEDEMFVGVGIARLPGG